MGTTCELLRRRCDARARSHKLRRSVRLRGQRKHWASVETCMSDSKEHVLWHQSGVNSKGEPFVQLIQDDVVICQLSPEEARDHAKNVLEATEASEQDAFMLSFMQQKEGLDVARPMQVIVDFKKCP